MGYRSHRSHRSHGSHHHPSRMKIVDVPVGGPGPFPGAGAPALPASSLRTASFAFGSAPVFPAGPVVGIAQQQQQQQQQPPPPHFRRTSMPFGAPPVHPWAPGPALLAGRPPSPSSGSGGGVQHGHGFLPAARPQLPGGALAAMPQAERNLGHPVWPGQRAAGAGGVTTLRMNAQTWDRAGPFSSRTQIAPSGRSSAGPVRGYPLRATGTRPRALSSGLAPHQLALVRPPHSKARGFDADGNKIAYPGNGPTKSDVPDAFVSWASTFAAYAPVEYTAAPVLAGPVWADKETTEGCKFGQVDGKVDRSSFEDGGYAVDEATGRPKNPRGRTGMTGRGLLGRWGPNHAADPIVTRWADAEKSGPGGVLEFVAIRRTDGGGWAIPGGMVEPGDTVSATLKKEFGEEALNSMEMGAEETQAMEAAVEELFAGGETVYRGYVDDPRNTDNAWMETVCQHNHAEDREGRPNPLHRLTLAAGDDAGDVAWTPITKDIKLYASHRDFVLKVAEKMGATL